MSTTSTSSAAWQWFVGPRTSPPHLRPSCYVQHSLFFLFQAKAGLGELRKSGGCIVWVSSGAAVKPYAAWAAYGSSKAAINSISAQLAVEEPNISTIAIAPGRVDTDMQAVLRASGKEVMDEAQYNSFSEAFHQGKLLKPEQPGHVIANLVANAQKDLTGKFLK